MLKIGDTVRFVNAVGGGVVSRFDEKKGLVYVEDEDGFEIPVMERECVVVPKVNPKTNFPARDFNSAKPATVTEMKIPAATMVQTEVRKPEIVETEDGDELKVVLAFLPVAIKNLQSSDYEAVLVNDSNYFLLYSVVVGESGMQRSVAHGMLEPNMQEQLAVLANADLNDWEYVRVQALAYKEGKSFKSQDVIDRKLQITPLKFYKLHSFTENDYFDEPAMVFNLISYEDKLLTIHPAELKKAILQKEKPEPPKVKREKTAGGSDSIEVDLHIHELTDTTTGMSNADMLQLQMDKFHEVIAANIRRKGQKIVFIHGKGEGVLRNELMKALKNRYKTFYVQDASFREYGYGATMIVIR